MSLIRWDEESRLRVVFGFVALGFGAFMFTTTERTNYLHLPAVVLIVLAAWSLLLAVAPDLRGRRGAPHRVLIVGGSYAVVLLILVVVGRAAVSP